MNFEILEKRWNRISKQTKDQFRMIQITKFAEENVPKLLKIAETEKDDKFMELNENFEHKLVRASMQAIWINDLHKIAILLDEIKYENEHTSADKYQQIDSYIRRVESIVKHLIERMQR